MRSVRQRLFLAFLVVLASCLMVTLTVIVANEGVVSRYRTLTDNLLQEYQLVKRAEPFVTDYFSYTKAIGDSGRRLTYQTDRQAYLDGLTVLENNLADKDSQMALLAVRNTVTSMLTEAEAAVREVSNGDLSKMSARYDEVSRLATFVRETGTELIINDLGIAARLNDEATRLRRLLDWLVLALLSSITLGGIIYIVSFTGSLVAPLLALVEFSKRAGTGDSSVQMPPKLMDEDDEMGTLATAFNQMVGSMRQRLKDLEQAHVRTKAIVEGVPFGAHTYRLEGDDRLVFIATNRSAEKMLGPDHVKLIGKTLEEAFPGNVGTDIPEAYRRVAVTGIPFERVQYSYDHGSIAGVFEIYAVQTAPQEVTVFFRDVTEKHRDEEQIRQSEAELKAAQAVAHVGSWIYDVEKGTISFSEELRNMLGLMTKTPQDLHGPIDRYVHPDDRQAVVSSMTAPQQGERPAPFVFRIVRSDGVTRNLWMEFGELKYDRSGRLESTSGVCQDITERLQAEQALADSERRYRAFVENTSDVIFAADATGQLTYVSPKISRYGMSGAEVVGRNFTDFVVPEDRERVATGFMKSMSHEIAPESTTMRLFNGKGETYWIEETDSVQEDEQGRAVGVIGVMRDVTDRQRALLKLAESERRWRAFIENSRDVVFASDLEGKLTYVSPQIRQYGFDADALVGQSLYTVVHPDDHDRLKALLGEILAGDLAGQVADVRLVAPDGTVTLMEGAGGLQKEDERTVAFVGILRDVTARRTTETAARQSMEMERLFARHSAILASVGPDLLDAKMVACLADLGAFFDIERSSLFLLGDDGLTLERKHSWFREGLAVEGLIDKISVASLPWAVKALQEAAIVSFNGLDKLPPGGAELMRQFRLPDQTTGALVPLRVEGKTIGVFVLVDGTGRHLWRESDHVTLHFVAELFGHALQRQKSEQRLREADIIIGLSSGVAFTSRYDRESTLTYVSRNVMVLTGYDGQEFLSGHLTIQGLIHPDDLPRVKAELVRRIEREGAVEFTLDPYRLMTKDGRLKWIQNRLFVERDANGHPVYLRGIIDDITTRRAAETKVTELDRLRQRFIHIVSHQLRTPLNSIRWSLEAMLSGELGEMKKEQHDFVRVVYDAEIEVISRIHDTLTALDIQEGRVTLARENVALRPLLSSVVSETMAMAERRGLTVVSEQVGETGATAEADADKLRFAFKTILQNAVIYSHEGGRVEITMEVTDGRCRLKVRDEGIGIPKAEQASIFNRFFRASNASVVNQNASGLGLSIAKYYLESHGGSLTFESVEGKGSTFIAEVPLA